MIRTILALAIPAALKSLLDMVQIMIDLIMVSALGIDELAAVGLGLQFVMVLGVVMTIFSVGGNATISRLKGSGRIRKANKALFNLVLVATILAIASTLILAPLTENIYLLMKTSPTVARLGNDYFGTLSLGFLFLFLDMLFYTYFSAMGNTTIPFLIKILSSLTNVSLNYILIYGHMGAPALGVRGAALATIAALAFNVVAYLLWIARGSGFGMIPSVSLKMIREIWRIGFPAAVERGTGSLSFMFFVAIIASYSTEALAGYQIGLRIEGLAFMPGIGFSVAAMTLVGQHLGRRDPENAQRAALLTAHIAATFMGTIGVFMVFFPEIAIHLFTQDPATVDQASLYLRLVGISQVPLAMMFVLSGALRGAGAVKLTLKISVLSLWLIRIIPSYIVSSLAGDILWVYTAMTMETFTKGFLFYYLFKKGSWKAIRIRV